MSQREIHGMVRATGELNYAPTCHVKCLLRRPRGDRGRGGCAFSIFVLVEIVQLFALAFIAHPREGAKKDLAAEALYL
jgi:hypothetical protein